MKKEELIRYIELGNQYGVRVDVRVMPEYPGYIRVVGFHKDNKLIVEFYALGYMEDAAFEFVGSFQNLESAIDSVEHYLDNPIENWVNYNKTGDYLETSQIIGIEDNLSLGHRNLVMDILNSRLKLPSGNFQSKHQLWSSIEEYDNYVKASQGS
jgi:hypothetical protein